MFKELTEELLDLKVTEKGYRGALYAVKAPDPCSCSCSIALCSSLLCVHLCW